MYTNLNFYENVIKSYETNSDILYFPNIKFTYVEDNVRIQSQKLDKNNKYQLNNIPFEVNVKL